MKGLVCLMLLLGATTMAVAEEGKYGLGATGTFVGERQTATGSPDYSSSQGTYQFFFIIPLTNAELDPFLVFLTYQENDPANSIDDDQSGFGGGVTFLGTLISAGPFALKSGIGGQFVRLGPPKSYSGSWSASVFSFFWPLVLDASFAEHWSIRITQGFATFSYETTSAGSGPYSFSSTDTNLSVNAFAPTIGGYYSF